MHPSFLPRVLACEKRQYPLRFAKKRLVQLCTGLFLFLTKKGIRTGGQSQIYTKYEFMLFNLRPNATGFAFATQACHIARKNVCLQGHFFETINEQPKISYFSKQKIFCLKCANTLRCEFSC